MRLTTFKRNRMKWTAVLLVFAVFGFSFELFAEEKQEPVKAPVLKMPIKKKADDDDKEGKKKAEKAQKSKRPKLKPVGGEEEKKNPPMPKPGRPGYEYRKKMQERRKTPPPPRKSSGVRQTPQMRNTPPPPVPGQGGHAAGKPSARTGAPKAGSPDAMPALPGTQTSPYPQMGGEEEGGRKTFDEFKPNQKYHIDYYEEDLLEFIKAMSEKFKVNFLIPDRVRGGKITIISPQPVTRDEAWGAFLSALNAKDYALTKVGGFYKLVKIKEAQRSPLRTYLDGGTTDASDELITYLLKLKNIDIQDIEKLLKDLKSKDGEIITFEPTGTLIITDTSINIRRMVKLVNELDVPGGRDSIHVIDIYYAAATDIADKLQQIFGEKGSRGSATPKRTVTRKRKGQKGGKDAKSGDGDDVSQVTLSNVIADERTNQLIVVAPRDAMPRILDMVNRLDVPIPGDGQIHVYYLENANAEELASTLTGMAGRGATGRRGKRGKGGPQASGELFEGEVKITADKATNSLVIVASTKDFNALKRVIKKLDLRRRQVFVEAVIMEIMLGKDHSQGLAMSGGYTFDIGGEKVPIFAGSTLGSMSPVIMNPTTLSGLAVGLRGPDLEGTEGMLGEGISLPAFGVIMQMLQTDSDANVLSTPHILTMDNEEAEIIVGKNVPFITGQARDSNNQPVLSIQRQDVALTLKIKPQINESDFVRLQVQQEVTELVSISETLGPTTTKRAAKSVVVVKDNQTIVIGGMLRDTQTRDTEKIPVLGDIPILGRLFRRDKEKTEKTNLLIFLTPHIIKDESDFKRIFKRKMEERAEFLRKFYGTDEDYEFEIDYTQKKGLVEEIRQTYEEQKAMHEAKSLEEKELIIAPPDGHSAHELGEGVDEPMPTPPEN